MADPSFEIVTQSNPEDDPLNQAIFEFDRTHHIFSAIAGRTFEDGLEATETAYRWHFEGHVEAMSTLTKEVLEDRATPLSDRLHMLATVLAEADYRRGQYFNDLTKPAVVSFTPQPNPDRITVLAKGMRQKLTEDLDMDQLRNKLKTEYADAMTADVAALLWLRPKPPTRGAKIAGFLLKHGKEVGRQGFDLATGAWLFRLIGPHV